MGMTHVINNRFNNKRIKAFLAFCFTIYNQGVVAHVRRRG